jgi:hypothetical protein
LLRIGSTNLHHPREGPYSLLYIQFLQAEQADQVETISDTKDSGLAFET